MARPLRRDISETTLDTWFERDRAFVSLDDARTGNSIVEWWDEAVHEAAEDGFLVFGKGERRLHESAYQYAEHLGFVRPRTPQGGA